MLELDGSGGGGQLVRTALTLSSLGGWGFEMTGIRAERPNPGLRPQHLAAIRALAEITDAEVEGTTTGSATLRFRPGRVEPGRYAVDVGTAGSIPLVFDAVLPIATELDGTLSLRAIGGTDVRWAPSMDYFRRVKLPLLRRHGLVAAVDVDRRGFYPVGGGDATLTLGPTRIEPLELHTPERPLTARTVSVTTDDLADREVAQRQEATALDSLAAADVDVVDRTVEYVTAASPGSVLTVRVDDGGSIAGFDALGERGKPAERVAEEAIEGLTEWVRSGAAVDPNLADQLLVFLGLSGGEVSIPAVTAHVETSVWLMEAFGYDVRIDHDADPPRVVA